MALGPEASVAIDLKRAVRLRQIKANLSRLAILMFMRTAARVIEVLGN